MEDKNYTIIEDIFNLDDSDDNNHFNNMKTKISFNRTLDSHSARPPYPSSNIPSLSYDEDMIKNKLSRQINPRVLASQYNSMSNTNRILQPPQPQQLQQQVQPQPQQVQPQQLINNKPNVISEKSIHNMDCRSIYDHIENCPICNKYYKQSNRTYILIIIFLVLIILLLLRQKN
jgi:hypothetical protein